MQERYSTLGITHYGRPGIREGWAKAFRPSRAGGHSGLKTLIFLSGFKRPREHEEGMEEGKGRYWAIKKMNRYQVSQKIKLL